MLMTGTGWLDGAEGEPSKSKWQGLVSRSFSFRLVHESISMVGMHFFLDNGNIFLFAIEKFAPNNCLQWYPEGFRNTKQNLLLIL